MALDHFVASIVQAGGYFYEWMNGADDVADVNTGHVGQVNAGGVTHLDDADNVAGVSAGHAQQQANVAHIKSSADSNISGKLNDLLNSDYYKNDLGYDCSEIAEDFYNAANEQGNIYRIEGKNGSMYGFEYDDIFEFDYHEVYSDGTYIYDPRYKNVPILKDDYFKALSEINPDGMDVFTVK